MNLLFGLLKSLPDLLPFLLRAQRCVLADADHLLVGGLVDIFDLLPRLVGDTGLLETGRLGAASPRLGSGCLRRRIRRRSALLVLSQQQRGREKDDHQGRKQTSFTLAHASASCLCVTRILVAELLWGNETFCKGAKAGS